MSKQRNTYDRVKEWIENPTMREIVERALPKHLSVDSWVQSALITVRTTADLEKCEPLSVMGALMTLASMGLRLEGPLGQAYLTARWVGTRGGTGYSHECQAQVGYRGLIDLAFRDSEVLDIESVIVHARDDFSFAKGSEQFLRHTWDLSAADRGPIVAVYSGVRYRHGYYKFQPYSVADILDLRAKILAQNGITLDRDGNGVERYFRKDRQTKKIEEMTPDQAARYPWIAHIRPMIQKTAIRWSSKFWRMHADLERAAALASLDEAGETQGLAMTARAAMPAALVADADGVVAPEETGGDITQQNSQARAATLRERMVAEMATRAAGGATSNGDEPQGTTAATADTDKVLIEKPAQQDEDIRRFNALSALTKAGWTDEKIRAAIGGPIDGAPVEFLEELIETKLPTYRAQGATGKGNAAKK